MDCEGFCVACSLMCTLDCKLILMNLLVELKARMVWVEFEQIWVM